MNKYIFLVNQFGKPVVNILSQNELTNNPLNLFGFKNSVYFWALNLDGTGTTKKIIIQ